MIIALTPYGKFPVLMDTFVEVGYKLQMPLAHIKPIWAMPGGGTTAGHVEDIVKKFGHDVMIAVGAGIHAHPDGPTAGARAFRHAIDAAVAGVPTDVAAQDHPELQTALDLWGYWVEGKGGSYNYGLKG
jgi:2,3-diketo-5-methylthiopentyl-1-phosphate enolase